MEEIWGYIIEGLFAVFLTGIVAAISASSNSFNALLYSMFASTTESQLAAIDTTQAYKTTLLGTLNDGATALQQVVRAQSNVFPLATYIVIFALFIGAILGIVVGAMALITRARSQVAAVVPVRPA